MLHFFRILYSYYEQVTKEGERLIIDQEQWLSTLKKVRNGAA